MLSWETAYHNWEEAKALKDWERQKKCNKGHSICSGHCSVKCGFALNQEWLEGLLMVP